MKEISSTKKYKAIKMFLGGYTFDEIALELGIAKGSVANILDEFKGGQLLIAPDAYIDTLRELAVDMRKQHVIVKQLKMYEKIHQKLAEMGVGIDEVDDWLDIVDDITTEGISSKQFVAAALQLARGEIETGHDPGSLVTEFKSKSEALNKLKAEVAQTTELKEKATTEIAAITQAMMAAQKQHDAQKAESKEKLDQYLAESELNWNMVTTVKAILHGELTKEGLGEEEIRIISKQIAEIGSLAFSIKAKKKENKALEEHIVVLKEDTHNMEMADIGLHKHNDQLASHVYSVMEGKKVLNAQMKEIKWQLKGLKTAKAGHALDIYSAWLMLAFLNDPSKIDNDDFDWLVEMLVGVRLARLGKGPKQAVDAEGKVICQCHVPVPYTPLKDYGVAMDKARERLAEYLVPLVKDKFVPKVEYEANKMMQEIIEMNKQLASAMSGYPGVANQLAGQPEPLEQETAKAVETEAGTDKQPDEAVNADAALPEQPAVLMGSLDYSPEAIKAKMGMEKKFLSKIGPRIDFSIPWEGGQNHIAS